MATPTTKPNILSMRLDAEAFARVAAAAEAAGLTPGAWGRLAVLGALGSGLDLPSAPAGTAPGSDRLTETVSGKLTPEQFEAARIRAQACGMTMAAYVRSAVLGVTPRARQPLARKAMVELNRVGNNLNQLTKLANSGSPLPGDLARSVAAVHAAVVQMREALEAEES